MRHFSKLFCLLLVFTLAGSAHAQLSAGDIAFVSIDSDNPDAFSFLSLTTISSGTEIKFTDNGWQSTGNFRSGEGTWTITFSADVDCGTEVQIDANGATDVATGTSVGDRTATAGSLALSGSGDQVLAYQGEDTAPVFIAAIDIAGSGWAATASNTNTSAVPPGLTDGMTAVAVPTIDNAQYVCTLESGSKGDLLMAINDTQNWDGSSTSRQVPAGCLFAPTDCTSGPGGGGGGGSGCADLFISEYIEGGGNNKCLELYNPTGGVINLTGYTINRFSNGGTNPVTITLAGSIPALGTYVICNPSASADFTSRADLESGTISHNGDDAYTLENNGVVIDRFGQVGFDPGSQWSSGGVGTANRTLVRKASVSTGDPNSGDAFDPSQEWEENPQDDFSFLGAHTSVCSQGGPGGNGCAELFISEYVEGSSSEKYIEVYNPTAGSVDLADYQLRLYSNGNSVPNSTSSLSNGGVLPSGGVMVFKNGNAGNFPGGVVVGAVNFNGDDAVELFNTATGMTADIFGTIGTDPGSAWTAPGYSTVNMTLRRIPSVRQGVTVNPPGAVFTTLDTEWQAFANNTFDGLGVHIGDCVDVPTCLITSVTVDATSGCQDERSSSQDDDFYMADVTVSVSNAPTTGNLELYGPNGLIDKIDASTITGGEAVFTDIRLPANTMSVMVTASFTDEDCSKDGFGPAVFPCSLPECTPVINELDYNNPSTDDREFVELYNPCSQPIYLADYSVIFVNGANGQIYGDFQLPAVYLAPGEFFVICGNGATTANCDLDVSPNTNLIQNGDPDAVALLYIDAIADAVSYEGSTTGFTEGSGDNLVDPPTPLRGIGRYVDGVDTDQNNADFAVQCITPGEPNVSTSSNCGLPGDIEVANIGCEGFFNDAGYDSFSDTYYVSSTCGHTFGGRDQLTFVGKKACGDAFISAKITSVFPSTGFAGITMHASADPGSRRMSIVRYSNGRKYVEFRPSDNAPYYLFWLPAFTTFMDYVRISRSGDYFYAAVSFDGNTWMTIYQQYMGGMPDCVQAGMIVSSYFNGNTTNAIFDDVVISDGGVFRPAGPATAVNNEPVDFNVFPNPAANELSVTVANAPTEEAVISIMALDGRELYRNVHNINGNTVNLQLSDLQMTAGMYILTVNTGEEVLTKRFVKSNP